MIKHQKDKIEKLDKDLTKKLNETEASTIKQAERKLLGVQTLLKSMVEDQIEKL
jgi:hypothetical protein